jgi:hypothetical protein
MGEFDDLLAAFNVLRTDIDVDLVVMDELVRFYNERFPESSNKAEKPKVEKSTNPLFGSW